MKPNREPRTQSPTLDSRSAEGARRYGPFMLHARRAGTAFTLLEVMIATAIFFMCVFAILALVSTSLRNARVLQQHSVDPGMLAGMTALTNRLMEGSETGDFEDIAPGSFPGFTWTRYIEQVASNGLFRVDLMVSHDINGKPVESKMSILLYRPESPPGSAFGGMGGGLR